MQDGCNPKTLGSDVYEGHVWSFSQPPSIVDHSVQDLERSNPQVIRTHVPRWAFRGLTDEDMARIGPDPKNSEINNPEDPFRTNELVGIFILTRFRSLTQSQYQKNPH